MPSEFHPILSEDFFNTLPSSHDKKPQLIAKKSSEYFIAIAQQERHTFLMLGVVIDGKRQLLARVGKVRRDSDNPEPFKELCGFMFSKVDTKLFDEGISRSAKHTVSIRYSAYAISDEQTLAFTSFLEKVSEKQIKRIIGDQCYSLLMSEWPHYGYQSKSGAIVPSNLPSTIESGYIRVINKEKNINALVYVNNKTQSRKLCDMDYYKLERYDSKINSTNKPIPLTKSDLRRIRSLTNFLPEEGAICSYKPMCPTDKQSETVVLRYTSAQSSTRKLRPEMELLYEKTQFFNKSNTCRHTAVDLLNTTRGSKKTYNVSSQFFCRLPVKTILAGGVPSDNIPFYIIPLPPTAFPNVTQDPASAKILAKLYRRMEEIITLEPHAKSTEIKFNKLKAFYNEQAGVNHASPEALIDAIRNWRDAKANEDVFQLRKTYFFDRVITRQSTTKKMFDELAPKIC